MPKREKPSLILPIESTDGAIRFDDGTVVEAQLAGKRITVEGAEVPYASKDEDRPPPASFRQSFLFWNE